MIANIFLISSPQKGILTRKDFYKDYLYFNKIKILKDGAFRGLQRLSELRLEQNEIELVEAYALGSDMPMLSTLELSANKIRRLRKSFFGNAKALTTLNLNANEIEIVEANSFENMPLLAELDLSTNRIQTIVGRVFTNLKAIKKLDFSRNRLISIDRRAFANLTKMSLLNLSRNSLDLNDMLYDNDAYLDGMQSLATLDLSFNKVTTLRKGHFFFNRLYALKELFMDHNGLAGIELFAFSRLNSLTSLSLEFNSLTQLKTDVFYNLTSLKLFFSPRIEYTPYTTVWHF